VAVLAMEGLIVKVLQWFGRNVFCGSSCDERFGKVI